MTDLTVAGAVEGLGVSYDLTKSDQPLSIAITNDENKVLRIPNGEGKLDVAAGQYMYCDQRHGPQPYATCLNKTTMLMAVIHHQTPPEEPRLSSERYSPIRRCASNRGGSNVGELRFGEPRLVCEL